MTGTPTGNGNATFVNTLDYILVYAKDSSKFRTNGLPLSKEQQKIYNESDEYGRFLTRSLRRTGGEDRREDRPSMYYGIEAPDGTVIYPIKVQLVMIADGLLVKKSINKCYRTI